MKRVGGFIFIAVLFGAASIAASPRITFTGTGATAEGIQPGGDAVWFVHSMASFAGSPSQSSLVRVVRDDDRDGIVSIESPVRPSSVWVVVDYASGEYEITRPEGAPPLQELRERGAGWAVGRAHVDFSVSELDVLVVRPGRGVWTMRCFQGSACDGDRIADANLRMSLSEMKVLHGGDRTPSIALPRDLIIAVHPTDLYAYVRSASEVGQ